MKKDDLIKFCRYYKGGEELVHTQAPFWHYEKKWVEFSLTDKELLGDMLVEYYAYGLRRFCQFDDTPITLKALLFNRYSHWLGENIEGFKKWYIKEYYQS